MTVSQRWVVISNCQAQGLANCIATLCPDVDVACPDPWRFANDAGALATTLASYDRVVVAPQVEEGLGLALGTDERVIRLPAIYFAGYHPDVCYLDTKDPFRLGPLGDYHSVIAYASYRAGLSVAEAAALYCESTYEALGYTDRWAAEANALVQSFRVHGYDIRALFAGWVRKGPFMHTVNHPRIECLQDLAALAVSKAGMTPVETGLRPVDNLALGPAFPVYPELARRIGVSQGSYLFKLPGYRCLNLSEFLGKCFELYRAHPESKPAVKGFLPLIEHAIAYVSSRK